MPYKYTAFDEDGNIVKGKIDVKDRQLAEEALTNAGYTPIKLNWARQRPSIDQIFPSLYGIKTDDIINFSRQLATLIEAGLTLPNSLRMLELQTEQAPLKKVISGLRKELEGGSSLSQALSKFPNAFSEVYCHIAEAGEHGGDIAQSLRRAVDHMERGSVAMKKAKRAMIYPAFVIALALCVILVLVSYVLPPLLDMFNNMNAEVPVTTRILMSVTDFASAYPLPIMGTVLGVIIIIGIYVSRPSGRRMRDRLILRLPILSTIAIQSNMTLFTRTASTLLAAGVPLTRIMDIVTQTAGNSVIRDALREVQEGLIQGHGLSKPMSVNKVFPPLLVQMVNVGEQTGTLDTSLENVAVFYEAELNQKIDSLTAMMEPVLTVGIALFVGFIALSVITPMYSVLGTLK